MLWLGVAYLGALGALFITSLWGQDDFTGTIQRVWTLDNFRDLITIEVYRTITIRTVLITALVTVVDAVLAFPIALYMAKVASVRLQRILVIAVLMPLWASYLVKAYAGGACSPKVGCSRRSRHPSASTHRGTAWSRPR